MANGNNKIMRVGGQNYQPAIVETGGYPVEPDGLRPPMRPPTQEERLGQPNFYVAGWDRIAGPEDSNADYALYPPDVWSRSALFGVPTVIPIQGGFSVIRADYNELANYAYFRSAAGLVDADGRNDQDEIPGFDPGTAGVFEIDAPTPPNLVLGFMLEWSLQRQISAPFSMQIETVGFKGRSWQSVDRNVALRVGGDSANNNGWGSSANGGILALLFGQRMSANDTCGWTSGGGCTAPASGGMQKAIVQPAWIAPYSEIATNPVFIPGTSLLDFTDAPVITVTVPQTLAAGFGVLARYITAGSPQMAVVRQALMGASR